MELISGRALAAAIMGTCLQFAVCFLLAPCASVTGQCSVPSNWAPSSDQEPLDAGSEGDIIDAILLLMCCADVSGNPLLEACCDDLLEMVEEGGRFYFDYSSGSQGAVAFTMPDLVCSGGWQFIAGAPPTNSFSFSSTGWQSLYAEDLVAGDVLLAGVLAHEYCHAVTLANFCDNQGEWDDQCGLWDNEITCYIVELTVVDCIVSCSCVSPYDEGVANTIGTRRSLLPDKIAEYTQMYTDC